MIFIPVINPNECWSITLILSLQKCNSYLSHDGTRLTSGKLRNHATINI